MRLISGFVDSYLELTAAESEQDEREVQTLADPEREGIMEIVTSWMKQGMEQGLQQGLQQGLEQGLQQGEAALLRRQMESRFGALPEGVIQKLEAADPATLEEWGLRLLTAESLADVMK